MNRLLQNGRLLSAPKEMTERHSAVDTGLDLTLRLGLPGTGSYKGNDKIANVAAAAQQQHRYGFVGPVRPQPTIIPDICRMNQPAGGFDLLHHVQTTRIVIPALCYGQTHPGTQPQMYMGYRTTSAVTIRAPPFPSRRRSSIRRPPRIRTYARYPDQRCNNLYCNTRVTPKWRNGPFGPKTLCNACGIEFRKCKESIGRRLVDTIAGNNI